MKNLAEIKPNEYAHKLVLPGTDEEIGLEITLISMNDDRMKKAKRDQQTKTLAKRQRNKLLTGMDAEENTLHIVTAAATGWRWYNDATWNGEALEFNRANLVMVLTTLGWAIDQLDEVLSQDVNFFQK